MRFTEAAVVTLMFDQNDTKDLIAYMVNEQTKKYNDLGYMTVTQNHFFGTKGLTVTLKFMRE